MVTQVVAPGLVRLLFNMPNGQTLSLDVSSNEPLWSAFGRVEGRVELPVGSLRMSYGGRSLCCRTRTPNELHLANGASVDVWVKQRGGEQLQYSAN